MLLKQSKSSLNNKNRYIKTKLLTNNYDFAIMLIMNVDLLSIINNTEKQITFESSSLFEDNEYVAEWSVVGRIVNFAGRLEITGSVSSVIKTKCARCLKPLEIPLSVEINETVGEDEIELEGTILNIDNIVKNNIVVELPYRFLCKDDCKGICSICGADLNITECDCKHEQLDERFAVLKQLLDSGNKPE